MQDKEQVPSFVPVTLNGLVRKFSVLVKFFSEGTLTELRERLEQLGLALQMEDQELAKVGGVVKQTYHSYKTGQSAPRFDVLQRWVRELGVDANWLLLGEGPMFRNPALVTAESKPKAAQEDPVVSRAERLAELMIRHNAPDEQIREAIMATIHASAQKAGESEPLYSLHETKPPYDTK